MNIISTKLKYLYHCTPYKWRVSEKYFKQLKFLKSVDITDDYKSWQLCKLKKLVSYAYENTDGYRQLFDEAFVKPSDIRTLEDINLLPFTSKELIRDNIKNFTTKDTSIRDLNYITTSGSSGIPFGFYVDKNEHWYEEAFVTFAWEQVGWNIKQSGILLRGSYVGDAEHIFEKCDNNDFYIHNNGYKLSPYFLTQDYYHVYKNFLLSNQYLHYIFAYPSSMSLLSALINSNGDSGKFNIKTILLGSENLYEWQISEIEKAFPTSKLMSCYGLTERVIFASWCSKSKQYHINPYYGITELLDYKNEAVCKEGSIGELIGTAFFCNATPFIRYRTSDYAVKGKEICEYCGANYLLLDRIDGRLNEAVVSDTGRLVSMVSINMHDSTFDGVAKFRFIQTEKGNIMLNIMPSKDFNNKNSLERIKVSIISKLGVGFNLQVNFVNDIKPSKSGKYSFLEQHLKITSADRIIY